MYLQIAEDMFGDNAESMKFALEEMGEKFGFFNPSSDNLSGISRGNSRAGSRSRTPTRIAKYESNTDYYLNSESVATGMGTTDKDCDKIKFEKSDDALIVDSNTKSKFDIFIIIYYFRKNKFQYKYNFNCRN